MPMAYGHFRRGPFLPGGCDPHRRACCGRPGALSAILFDSDQH